MAGGGPINGSGMYGKDLVSSPVSIVVPTVLQMAADTVDMFTHMTAFYDPNWSPRPDMLTYKLAMFYVTDFTEDMQSETSERRIILYEPGNNKLTVQDMANKTRPGVQEVIVDNVVRKPKEYTLQVVIPFKLVAPQFTRTVGDAVAMLDGMTEVMSGVSPSALLGSVPTISVLNVAAQTASKIVDIASSLQGNDAANHINKNSIEAMWERGQVLKMKMWSGYQYKYVVITNVNIKKVGKEDDVFRGTIKIKELPVLSVTQPRDGNKPTGKVNTNWVTDASSIADAVTINGKKMADIVADFLGMN